MTKQEIYEEMRRYDGAVIDILKRWYAQRGIVSLDIKPTENELLNADRREATDFFIIINPHSSFNRIEQRLQVRLRKPHEEKYYRDDFTISGPLFDPRNGWQQSIEHTEFYKMQKYAVAKYLYGVQGDGYTVKACKLIDLQKMLGLGYYEKYDAILDNPRGWDIRGGKIGKGKENMLPQKFYTYSWGKMPRGTVLFEHNQITKQT